MNPVDPEILQWILAQKDAGWYGVALLRLQTDEIQAYKVWQIAHSEVEKLIRSALIDWQGKMNITRLVKETGISRATIYRLYNQGKLPALAPFIKRHRDYKGV